MSPLKVERRALIIGLLLIAVIMVVGLSVAVAAAEEQPVLISAPAPATQTAPVAPAAKVPATAPVAVSTVPGGEGGYSMEFTLPTFGKSGCLVCHGDRNLVIAKGDSTVSYWIDEEVYSHSAHSTVICTGCHIDYGYKAPHDQPGTDWRSVAKQACKNCHSSEFQEWSLSAHAVSPTGDAPDPKAAQKPLCGDCHGNSHGMATLTKNPAGKAAIRAEAEQMCGRDGCHADYWANWTDSYHGVAFKTGAEDAPSCWTCHGAHTILGSEDRLAPTNTRNLGGTNSCGTQGCHQDAGPAYASYAPMIHGRDKFVAENPIVRFIDSVLKRN